MPTLDWIGKSRVVNHHLDVPYCVLDRKYSFDEKGQHEEDNGSENMIIHGDNLLALKSLLPQYEGRIKCIYIDPPYNTGNEGWIYNDNVNDPHIKDWLNKVVGKEGEDLSRHDKWLCMMYPRLKLLQRLLAEDGAIFISIDGNEYSNLKLICDEIFGLTNYVDTISWFKKASPSNDAKFFSNDIEFILVYSRDKSIWLPHRLPLTQKQLKYYSNPDKDSRGDWNSATYTCNKSKEERPNLYYPIVNPNTGEEVLPKETAVWKYSQAQTKFFQADNRLFWGADGTAKMPRIKKFLSEHEGVVNRTLWHYDDVNHTQGASNQLKAFDITGFSTPKPVELIQRILQIASDPDSIILDSFAGSGTTAHAVLNLNKADGGHRKFILVEMGDYADNITAERVKRVIKGYDSEDDKEELVYNEELKPSDLNNAPQMLADAKTARQVARDSGEYDSVGNPKIVDNHLQVVGKIKTTDTIVGTGGSFSYYELGEPVFDGDLLNESVSTDEIRRYVYFTETKQHLEPFRVEEPYYMGTHMDAAYYFNYEKETVTTLNRDFLHTVKTRADGYVIYADLCTLSRRELEKWHITFKKIPRDISRL